MPNLRKSTILIGAAIVLFGAELDVAASYVPFDWNLSTSVTSPTDPTSVQRFTQVNSPFQESSFAAIGVHSSQAIYDFSFQPELGLGSFNNTVQLSVGAALGIHSTLAGRVRITPDVDTPVQIDAFIEYATPPTPVVDVSLRFFIFDIAAPSPLLFLDGGTGGTVTLNPAVGSLSASGNPVLLAGRTYQIGWDTHIRTLNSTLPGGTSTVSGYFTWSLTPEPGTALMLGLFAACALIRRRRQRS